MPNLRSDPTRTMMIRYAFVRDIRCRFNMVKRAVWQMIAVEDALGLGRPTTNAPTFKFETDDKKLSGFNRWLKKQIDNGILQINPTSGEPLGKKPWTYRYIDSAYKQGALRAYFTTHPELGAKSSFYAGSQQSFLQTAFGRPERTSKLRLLYTRSYEDLKGITAQMATQMSRVLADGIAHGKGPIQVARTMSSTIGAITKRRAEVLARTEIINAHAEGQLDGFEDLGIEQVGADVEFSTAGDDGVCPICESMEGKLYKIADARGVIPVHPNCRCSWLPVIEAGAKLRQGGPVRNARPRIVRMGERLYLLTG